MAEKKQSWLNKLIVGSEKAEGYARASLPSNRWELFWDILKGRFSKICIINLLIVLFIAPVLIFIFFRTSIIMAGGITEPFSQNVGIGYIAVPNLLGLDIKVINQANLMFFSILPLLLIIASVGIAGGMYVMRNMVWTEGIFVSNDFWRGIKLNFFPVMMTLVSYSVVLFIINYNISTMDYMMAIGEGNAFWIQTAKITSIIVLGFTSIMALFMLSMSVTYELKFFKLVKNAFIFTLALMPQSIFFAVCGLLPFLLFLIPISFLQPFAIILILVFAFAFFMLVWTNYSQWAFDKFINDRVEGAVKNRGIYEKVSTNQAASMEKYKAQLRAASNDPFLKRPVKPITDKDIKLPDLPSTFNRNDLYKMEEEKQKLRDDGASWAEEHKDDKRYHPSFFDEEEPSVVVKNPRDKSKKAEAKPNDKNGDVKVKEITDGKESPDTEIDEKKISKEDQLL